MAAPILIINTSMRYEPFRNEPHIQRDETVCLVDSSEAEIPLNGTDEAYLYGVLERTKHVHLITANNNPSHFERFDLAGVHHWPVTFFYKVFNNNHLERRSPQRGFQRHYVALTNKSKSHRFELINHLHQHGYHHQGIITWRAGKAIQPLFSTENHFDPTVVVQLDGDGISADDARGDITMTPPPFYDDAAIDFITESIYDPIQFGGDFVTEKSAKALWCGKMFIALAHPGYHKWLSQLGFELYDELFDYGFDAVVDRQERFYQYFENVVKINAMTISDLEDAYRDNSDKIEHNAELARSITWTKTDVIERCPFNQESFTRYGPTHMAG